MSLRPVLGIQLTLPEEFEGDAALSALLRVLNEEGFEELELNIPEVERVEPWVLSTFLGERGFRLTRLATGAAARRHGLSLSAADETVRTRSVRQCAAMLRYAARFPAELIIGIIKGMPGPENRAAGRLFSRSLGELTALFGRSPVPVLLEVTNRMECPVACTPQEAAHAIAPYPAFGFRVLLDTYHLHREGLSPAEVVASQEGLHGSIHLSDDNRRLPGLGGMDFAPILRALDARGYTGSLVLEGTFGPDPRADIRRSSALLRHLLVR